MSCHECSSERGFARIAWALGLVALLVACGGSPPAATEEVLETELVVEPLTPDATDEVLLEHLLAIERQGVVSAELVRHFPDLDRERAYRLQRMRLERKEATDARVGWKIGWSRQTDPRVSIDPVFGHILMSNVYQPGQPVPTDGFVNGQALVEAEVAVWLNQDLPGPAVTRDDVMGAIQEVGGVIELLNPRVGADGEATYTHDHGIADNVFHIGVMFGDQRAPAGEIDWAGERVSLEVNGEARAEGRMSYVMGRDPAQGVVWIANELLKYGYQLRAGDVVITGTVVEPPPIGAGDAARLTYSTLGTVELLVAEGGE